MPPYQVDLGLAIFFNVERIGNVEAGVSVPEQEEGLVRSFGSLSVSCGENYFQAICNPEIDRLRQGSVFYQPVGSRQSSLGQGTRVHSYFSLRPPPTPVPLPWTDTVASLKLHDAAAQMGMADDRRKSSCESCPRKCIANSTRRTGQRRRGTLMDGCHI